MVNIRFRAVKNGMMTTDGENIFHRFLFFQIFSLYSRYKNNKVFVSFDGAPIKDERNSFDVYPEGDGVMMYNIRYCFGPESGSSRNMYRTLYS